MKAAHHSGTYARRAKHVRDTANADPSTRCWRCGRTLREHGPLAKWTAGHLIDGDPNSPLKPEASQCNYAAGAARGRALHATPTRSKVWK